MQHILDTLTGQNKENLPRKPHGVKLSEKHLDITEDIKNEVRKYRPNSKVVSHSEIYSAFLEFYKDFLTNEREGFWMRKSDGTESMKTGEAVSRAFIEKVCEVSDNKYLKSTSGDLVYLLKCTINENKNLYKIGKSSVKNINARVEAVKTGLSDYGLAQVSLIQVNQCLSESFFFQKYGAFRTKFGEAEGKTEWFDFDSSSLDEVMKDFEFGKDLEPLQQSLL